jgi:hypothetical protein
MLLLQTHRDATSSSAPRACLTARPLRVCLRRRIAAHGALGMCSIVVPNLVSTRTAAQNNPPHLLKPVKHRGPDPSKLIEDP